jgi:hypothetical protein
MAIVYVPWIASADRDAFRQILGSYFPPDFDGWYQNYLRGVAAQGDNSKDVPVSPDEFGKYCKTLLRAPDWNDVLRFAVSKGQSQSKP